MERGTERFVMMKLPSRTSLFFSGIEFFGLTTGTWYLDIYSLQEHSLSLESTTLVTSTWTGIQSFILLEEVHIVEGQVFGIHYEDPSSDPIIPYASSLSSMLSSTGYADYNLVDIMELNLYNHNITDVQLTVQWNNTEERRLPGMRPLWGELAVLGMHSPFHPLFYCAYNLLLSNMTCVDVC